MIRRQSRLLIWLTILAVSGPSRGVAADSQGGIEFFEKRVRPLLVKRCYECHSASAKKLKAGLYLDSKAGWSKGGDSGTAIVPGKPEDSLLIRAVRWTDPDTRMPPKRKLTAADIAALEQWVKMGAPDPREPALQDYATRNTQHAIDHWAYQPLANPAPPIVEDTAWPRTDIDRFILAKLESLAASGEDTGERPTPVDRKGIGPRPHGTRLQPAPDADPGTLCRRLYFDLIGLPPTPEELDAFEQSAIGNRQSAISNLVDRLLASPRFGEHFGRHWLDVARFGESLTLRGFIFKEAWRYRDYVIDSFNRDAPINQFIREQIAGDLLPTTSLAQRRRQIVATTFLALGNSNLEEQDKKQLDMDVVDEQLDTLGKAILGQTIGCARCHDHKFDPIPTRDYYAMAGILRNTHLLKHANVSEWREFPLPVEAAQEKKLKEHESALASLEARIKSAKDAARKLAESSAGSKPGASTPKVIAARDLPGIVVDSSQAKQIGAWKRSTFSEHYIGEGYLHDDQQGKGEKTLSFTPEITRPGRYEIRFAFQHGGNRATNVPVTIFHADGETTLAVNERELPLLEGRFASLGTFRFEANGFGYVLVSNEGTTGYVTADAVQFIPADERPPMDRIAAVTTPSPSAGAVSRENSKRASPSRAAADADRAQAGLDIKSLEDRLKELKQAGPKRPMAMGVKETDKVDDCPIHVRGSVHNLGAVVPRGFLTFGRPVAQRRLPEHESGRRQLAEWLASPSNPLTARVYVNRVWSWLLGEGLVRSVDNFGTTGDAPSHPELLDHLASRFIEQGWSTKGLVREIVMSRVYQQAGRHSVISNQYSVNSRASAPLNTDYWLLNTNSTDDPENRLLSHARRRRLTAEQLRDAMLAISGQLDLTPPAGQTFPTTLAADFGFVYTNAQRSVYAPVFRNALPELFEAFDFPSPSLVTGKRNVSTVATQALFLLNHPFVRQQAQAAARRLLAACAGDDGACLDRAYRLCLGRPPTDAERDVALRHLGSAQSGESREEAWTGLFHALFASADFRYIE
jgi:hypothetical protein